MTSSELVLGRVGVAGARFHRVVVALVGHGKLAGFHAHQSFQFSADRKDASLVVAVPIPHSNAVARLPSGKNRSGDLVPDVKSLSHEAENRALPSGVDDLRGSALEGEDPFASLKILGILPHGLDAGLEQVIVGVVIDLAGLHEVVIIPPEILNSSEAANGAQVRLITLLLTLDPPLNCWALVVPERPFILQRMRDSILSA